MKYLMLPLMLVACLAQASVITISDDFEGVNPSSNWISFTNFTDNVNTTSSVSYPGSGGIPTHWARTLESYTTAGAQYEAMYLFSTPYNPVYQGAISFINFSLDTIRVTTAGSLYVRAVVEQGGTYYVAGNISPTTSWASSSATLTSANFAPNFFPASHPNFTSLGGPLSFGYLIGSNTFPVGPGAPADLSPIAGVDNFKYDLNVPNPTVPEPGSWSLMLVGACFVGRRWMLRARS